MTIETWLAFHFFQIWCYVQALAAASKTVDCLKIVHSLHAYFLLIGDFNSKYIIIELVHSEQLLMVFDHNV